MHISVIIEGEVVKRLEVFERKVFNRFTPEHIDGRAALINAYVDQLRRTYPGASFQLTFESRMKSYRITCPDHS